MRYLDLELLYFFNSFAGKVESFDKIVLFISENHLLKGGIFVLLIWLLWFNKQNKQNYRPTLTLNIIGCFVTMFLARVLAISLPYRIRPVYNPLLEVNYPIGMSPYNAAEMSSFPSDHAALFTALAIGMFFISKKIGIISLLYVFLIIFMPRVILGLHYPSDILGGAIIGVLIIVALNKSAYSDKINKPIFAFKEQYPGVFYALFFLITYQIADMFDSVRATISFLYSFIN